MKHQPITEFQKKVDRCALCFGKDAIIVPKLPKISQPPPRVFILGEQPDREAALAGGENGLDGGDPAAERLRRFLEKAGVDPADVYYATSVLCVPRDAAARPRRPTATEAKNCTEHVQQLLALLSPKLVIPLGHTAIQTIQWIYKDWRELRQFILNYDVGNVLERNGIAVYPLYHTSASTLKARSETRQTRDWQRIPVILKSMGAQAPAR